MAPNSLPPEQPSDRLVVAITARALFDLEDSHALFQASGLEAYARFQRSREKEVLPPGIAFPLVQKLLALNEGCPPEAPRVEVVLLSRNSSDTGLRIFNSIQHYGLGIVRAVFTSGAEVWPYIRPFGAQLFLSANPDSVRSALEHGVAAATILPSKPPERTHDQLRIAFDGDAVIFSDEAERVFQAQGLSAFQAHERDKASQPLLAGPLALGFSVYGDVHHFGPELQFGHVIGDVIMFRESETEFNLVGQDEQVLFKVDLDFDVR